MNKKLLLLATSLMCAFLLFSQDPEAQARMHYTMAEEHYNGNTYYGMDKCVEELTKAENILGATNAKILYLKIQAMNRSAYPYFYVYDLDTSLTRFFSLVDSRSYAAEKYNETLKVKLNLDNARNGENTRQHFAAWNDPGFKHTVTALYNKGEALLALKDTIYAIEFYKRSAGMGNTNAAIRLGNFCMADLEIYNADTDVALNAELSKVKGYNSSAYKETAQIEKAFREKRKSDNRKGNIYQCAIAWYSLAANKGVSGAMYTMGDLYSYEFYGVPSGNLDYGKAIEWYKKAAQAGDTNAMIRLGNMYTEGTGVEKNKKEAKFWYDMAEDR